MATSKTELDQQVRDFQPGQMCLETLTELSNKSFETFCDDISGMFGVDVTCNQQQVCTETADGLKERLKNLVAVSSVKAEGPLEGTFQLVFDMEGLFTLAGVILMHPEQMVLENRKLGSLEKARDLSDALKEAGETLIGSWNRVFHKGLDGHVRFLQTNTFIGNPWDKSDEKISLDSDEELVFVPYEMTIAPYPVFKCGVIFPKKIFAGTSVSVPQQPAPAEEKTEDQKAAIEKTEPENSNLTPESDSEKSEPQEPIAEEVSPENTVAKEDTEQTNATQGQAPADEENNNVDTDASGNVAAENAAITEQVNETESGPVSETIQKMTHPPDAPPGEPTAPRPAENPALSTTSGPLAILAKDIMQKDVLWGNHDDSIQHALETMQQHNAGYMMIGHDGVLEGIVSRSDLSAAISPYLRPAFTKWRRPLDDATLQIKLKWIMSTPVHTIRPQTPLPEIMQDMCQSSKRCLPVTDQQNKVQGLITAFDIFKAFLNNHPNIPTEA